MPRLKDETFPRPVKAIEVAPKVKVLPADLALLPALGTFEWHRCRVIFEETNQRGTAYVPIIRVKDAYMRVTEVEKLPFGISAEVIMRLVLAGFVEGGAPAPSNTVVNVQSLLEHYERCLEDPEFWTAEKKARYRDACSHDRMRRRRSKKGAEPKTEN